MRAEEPAREPAHLHVKLRFSAGQNILSTALKDGWDKAFAAKTKDENTSQLRRKQPRR